MIREIGRREIWKKLGPISKRKAEEIRVQVLNQILNGEHLHEPVVHLYFGEFVDKFINEFAIGSRSPNTVRTYREQLKPLRMRFQGIRLCALRNVLQKAVEWKYLAKSPTDGMRRFSESSQGSRALTPEELAKIFDGLTTWQRSLIRVMVNSGLRPGEVANLKFQDIDWGQVRLTVANDKTRKTKNRKSRIVPMNPDLRNELLFLKDHLPFQGYILKTETGMRDFKPREDHQREYVFCKKDGSRVACIRLSLIRAFKKHGIQGVTPHGLRKTFCSLLARQKVHPRVAQQLMGHSKIDLTMRVYTEVYDEQLREAVNLLPSMPEMKRNKFHILPGGGD